MDNILDLITYMIEVLDSRQQSQEEEDDVMEDIGYRKVSEPRAYLIRLLSHISGENSLDEDDLARKLAVIHDAYPSDPKWRNLVQNLIRLL